MMENFCNLPLDLVIEILLFLPAKSLMRFKCVCKSWHALISSRQFISMHLNHNNNACLLVKHSLSVHVDATVKNQNVVLSLISDMDNDFSSIVTMNVDVPFFYEYVQLVGHHNGIICLFDYLDDVSLCNPAMREFRVLPKSCIPKPYNLYDIVMGFGYDCQTNDYKVIRIMEYWNVLTQPIISHQVEVYTLSNDSWREIKDVQLEASISSSDGFYFQMHFNGVYYWCANTKTIVSFDMTNEVFQTIPMPDFRPKNGGNLYNTSLVVFNESITLIHYPYNKDQKSLDFWVMDEFGVKGTWTKLFSIGPLRAIQMPLIVWKNSELLMEGNGQVISYNLKTQEIRNLPIHGIPNSLTAAIYVNSLVSIQAS